MRKQFATLLILVLALGLLPIHVNAESGSGSPLVLKEGADDNDSESDDSGMDDFGRNGSMMDDRQFRDLRNEEVRMRLKERIKAFKEEAEQLKQEREKWMQLYQQKKEQYNEFKDDWNSARDDWRAFKGKVADFDSLSEEDQAQVIEKLKKFMTATLDRMESHTEILERWVSNVDLDDSTAQDLQTEIDQIQVDLEDFKTRVNETDNIDDLRTLGQEIRDYWQDNKHILKKTIAELSDLRMDHLVTRLETISTNMQDRIDTLDAEGVDITEMQTLLDTFNDNVASGKEQLNLAKEAYDNITSDNQEEQFQLAKEYLKKANEYFREAYKNLKDLIKLYRNTDLGKNADLAELSVDPASI